MREREGGREGENSTTVHTAGRSTKYGSATKERAPARAAVRRAHKTGTRARAGGSVPRLQPHMNVRRFGPM